MKTLPNDNIVMSTYSSNLLIWNVTDTKVKMLNSSAIRTLTTLPNGDIVIVFWPNRIEIWNSNNLTLKKNFKFTQLGFRLLKALTALSNEEIVIGYSNGRIEILNATDGTLKSRFRDHRFSIKALATIPNGGIIITYDSTNYIKIWFPSSNHSHSDSFKTFLYDLYISLVYMIKTIISSK
jgi:WD40 repeat protein